MKLLLLLFSLALAGDIPGSGITLLRNLITNSIPNIPYNNFDPQHIPFLSQKTLYQTAETTPNNLDNVFAQWESTMKLQFLFFQIPVKIPDIMKNQYRAIAFTQITEFAVFKFLGTSGFYGGTLYFGGASYNPQTGTVQMAFSVTFQLFSCLVCSVPQSLCPFTPNCGSEAMIPAIQDFMKHYGCLHALATIPPSFQLAKVDPTLQKLCDIINNQYNRRQEIQNDMNNQLQQANQITKNEVGKLAWYSSIASAQFIQGVNDTMIDPYLNYLITLLGIPQEKQKDAYGELSALAFATDGSWNYKTILYDNSLGKGVYCWVGGYHDVNKQITHWIYGTFTASFVYQPDVYVMHSCHREFFVFKECNDDVFFVPHPINNYDIQTMDDLFELSLTTEMHSVLPC